MGGFDTAHLLTAWPAPMNFQVWKGVRTHHNHWIDDTKAPFRSA